ncbi:MAG: ribosomal-processing cysteine protease Prp [Clostridia bacterium]|nr:ribosomal-processing cysteine protease Prp [Clostridia bacterium]
MITVSYKDTNGVRELVCSGHAGYGGKAAPPSPQGEGLGGDIVCAAASALTGTLAAVLLKHDEEFFSLFVGEGDGECRIVCAGAVAKPYFEFALVGLKKLAEAFPENVRVADLRESEEFH